MKKWKRSLFFWVLVIAFFITAPAVILRARGYRFDFNRGIFVYSGSITIKSNPQDIDVILDGKINKSKKIDRINSASQISGLLPKEYNLQVTAPGFKTWSKKTKIRSGISSEFWNVLLVKENYEKIPFILSKSNRFFISPKANQLASTNQVENNLNIDILNIEKNEIAHSFSISDLDLFPEKEGENIEWSPKDNQYISIPTISQNNQKDYQILNFKSEKLFSLQEFFNIPSIKNVRFHPREENYLFFLSENTLYKANLLDSNDLEIISQDVSAFNMSGEYIYFSQFSNQITYRKNLNNLAETEQITNNLPIECKNISKLIIYDKDRIAFIDEKKDLYIFNKGEQKNYFKKLSSKTEGLHFSDDGKKLLFWTQNEISVYFLRKWDVQPTRDEDTLFNIARYIEPIKNVQWFSDYEHILFSSGPYIKVIEIDSRDKRNSMDILTIENDFHFFTFDALLEKLFFISKENKLYYIEFPEPIGILGF